MLLPEVLQKLSLYEQGMDASSCGITIADAQSPDMPLIYVNAEFQRMTGYSSFDLYGRNCRLLQRDDRDQPALAELRKALQTPSSCTVTLRNYRKDGSLFWNELHLAPIHDIDNVLTHFVGVQTDVTARVKAEERRDAYARDLEEANQALRDFAHIVAHDLKAPLRAIRVLTQWLAEDSATEIGVKGNELLERIIRNAEQMETLIGGVLNYSRIGMTDTETALLDMNILVREVVDSLAPPADLHIDIQEPLPPLIANPVRIGQIFQNLIGNAITYMDKPHGKIRVNGMETADAWQFSVADNGPGLEPRHHEKIFTIFHSLQRDSESGSGVGLTIVRKIVEHYGGRVWLDSAPGEGSTFYFTVAKARAE